MPRSQPVVCRSKKSTSERWNRIWYQGSISSGRSSTVTAGSAGSTSNGLGRRDPWLAERLCSVPDQITRKANETPLRTSRRPEGFLSLRQHQIWDYIFAVVVHINNYELVIWEKISRIHAKVASHEHGISRGKRYNAKAMTSSPDDHRKIMALGTCF